jgi:hypothetical protein
MSTKTTLAIILSLVLVAFAGAGWFFLTQKSNTGETGTSNGFFPFGIFEKQPTGGGGDTIDTGDSSKTTGNQNSNEQKRVKLSKISDTPVAGFIVFEKGSSTIVRYVEKGNGHIQEVNTASLEKKRVSNTTIPQIHEAIFSDKGEQVLLRYLKEGSDSIQTFSGKISPKATSTDEGILIGAFLDEDIKQIAVSPDKLKIFTLSNYGGSSIGTISLFDGTKKSQIFQSSFTEWLPQWVTTDLISLNTKPSSSVFGFDYSITTKNSSLTKILGEKYGLTTLTSPDGNRVLFSENTEYGLPLSVLIKKTKVSYSFGLATLSEKCAWYQNNIDVYCAVPESTPRTADGYPDSWYQGLVNFSDTIWKIDTESGATDQLINLRETSREPIDATLMQINQNGDTLVFVNKTDNSLWLLSL